MKYLKLFEDVNDDYFKKVSTGEFQDKFYGPDPGSAKEEIFIKDNWDQFTKTEISLIVKFFDKKKKNLSENHTTKISHDGLLRITHEGEMISSWNGIGYEMKTPTKLMAKFIKLKDEWYGFEYFGKQNGYYICDQWDGLIKCLEDII
jgi:hypothetical protein